MNPTETRAGDGARAPRAIACALLVLGLAACGGGDPAGSGPLAQPPARARALSLAAASTPSTPIAADEFFDWAQQRHPDRFPGPAATLSAPPYVYRHYPSTGQALGVAGGVVYHLDTRSGAGPQRVDSLERFACEVQLSRCEAPRWRQAPRGTSVPAGLPAFFDAELAGGPSLRFQWLRDGQAIAGADGPTLVLPRTSPADDGAQLQLRVDNPLGTLLSDLVPLRVTPAPDLAAAAGLALASGCMNCHQVDQVGGGPAFRDVAGRYARVPSAVDDLVLSIRLGSAGVWNGFMPPHPRLVDDELRLLATAILSLAPPGAGSGSGRSE